MGVIFLNLWDIFKLSKKGVNDEPHNNMELEAKEVRMVILRLKKLLQETLEKMESVSDEDEEYVYLSNDAMLIDTMIQGLQEEYDSKFLK